VSVVLRMSICAAGFSDSLRLFFTEIVVGLRRPPSTF